MNTKLIRNLIEAGYSDEEIDAIIKVKSVKAPEAKPAEEKAPEAKPAEEKAPEAKPEANTDALINAIKSLETTIKASNLITSVMDTQNTEKSVDDVLAEMLAPKGGK